MSLQRIFESARKLGLPVIVTDLSGRDPMVVLPLEQFEAMAGAGEAREPTPIEMPHPSKREMVPESAVISPVSLAIEVHSSVPDQVASSSSEISLEEGFYLEQIDDQGGI